MEIVLWSVLGGLTFVILQIFTKGFMKRSLLMKDIIRFFNGRGNDKPQNKR
ncbi:hypothetical protein [Bacillus rhizoplanae]|uniref:hypothetical protein n=1 Tax=Bacillus rhizoplanae TaxID=2880966 RepID=UPI003D1FC521